MINRDDMLERCISYSEENTMTNTNLTLTMLGTGHATVTKCYNTCFLLHENEEYFMIDAGGGNGILGILEEQGIELNKIHDLFVTHAHSDHILGAVWIIRKIGQLMRQREYEGELRIYGHEQVVEGLQTICGIVLMKKVTKLFGNRIRFIVLQDRDEYRILNKNITFYDIKATKLLQFGFRIREEGFIFCGDEPLSEELYEYARGAKYMLHEAFCLEAECEKFKPHEKKHSTVKDTCMLAEKLEVKNLILMHTEDSYVENRNKMWQEKQTNHDIKKVQVEEHCIRGRKELYISEGQPFFSGNLYVPDDGESIRI